MLDLFWISWYIVVKSILARRTVMNQKLFKFIFAAVLSALLILLTSASVSAKTLTSGISLINLREDIVGDNYKWDNRNDTLTVNNLKIITDDEYGLKIADGATVILKGKNYIKASKAAIYLGGNVKFKGTGSLTVDGGEFGIYCSSTNINDKISFIEGSYTITGQSDAINAVHLNTVFSGGTLELKSISGYSVNAKNIYFGKNVSISAKGTVYSSRSTEIQAATLLAEAAGPVLISDGSLKIENVFMKVGSSLSELATVDKYNDEKAISLSSSLDESKKSILFGENYPLAVDIILLLIAITALSAAVIVPPIIKKKKAQKIIEKRKL